MSEQTLGAKLIAWAERERSVSGLIMIGSRARSLGAPDAADVFSDWDFQVITPEPKAFSRREWLARAGLPEPIAYVFRRGRLGQASKASIVFACGEMDLVVISASRLRLAKLLSKSHLVEWLPGVSSAMSALALVLLPGYRVLKGADVWGNFLQSVVEGCQPKPLSDADACILADGFVVDYVSTWRKIQRAEFLAAQRWLHHQLAETNFALLSALEERAGRRGFPDARRIERTVPARWRMAVTIEAHPEERALRAAVERSAETLRLLMQELVGNKWQWPELPLSLRAE